MGFFSGLREIGSNAGRILTAPARGAAKIVSTHVHTGLKVGGDLVRLQPGKALDHLQEGLHQQVDNVMGIPKEEWSAVKGAARGYGQVLVSGNKLIGEPIRGVARTGCNLLSAYGSAGGRLLEGDGTGARRELAHGGRQQIRIFRETALNELEHLK